MLLPKKPPPTETNRLSMTTANRFTKASLREGGGTRRVTEGVRGTKAYCSPHCYLLSPVPGFSFSLAFARQLPPGGSLLLLRFNRCNPRQPNPISLSMAGGESLNQSLALGERWHGISRDGEGRKYVNKAPLSQLRRQLPPRGAFLLERMEEAERTQRNFL